MNRRQSLDSLLAILTLAFGVLCGGALIFDFWSAADALAVASAKT